MIEADLPEIDISHRTVPLPVANNGHTLKASHDPGSQITVDGRTCTLLQIYLHTLSKNRIEGRFQITHALSRVGKPISFANPGCGAGAPSVDSGSSK